MKEKIAAGARFGSVELYSAWYYYECLPDSDGIYFFFSNKVYIRTNWPTPGMVPNGIGVRIHTVRLLDLKTRHDEKDPRNWLRLLVANQEDPLKLPPWILYKDSEVRLPLPVHLSEAQMFMFQISIDASEYMKPREMRNRGDALTLFIGVTEARSF